MKGDAVKDYSGDLFRALEECAPGAVKRDVALSSVSRWAIGGPARYYVEPRSPEEAAAVLSVIHEYQSPHFVMGDATNVLFDSRGFEGVVLRISRRMSGFRIDGEKVHAEAGVWVPQLARAVGCAGLTGMEHTIGIPGTLGGLVLMNGGSQRKGIGLNVERVLVSSPQGELIWVEGADCGFSYRTSRFQKEPGLVLAVELAFTRAPIKAVRSTMLSILRSRRARFPKKLPNCGSTFLSDPRMYQVIGPPGKAIEEAGLKGLRRGDAVISEMHANFIVNEGSAHSDDILWLIAKARSVVKARTGYEMDCEVRYVSPDGLVRPAHQPAEERWQI